MPTMELFIALAGASICLGMGCFLLTWIVVATWEWLRKSDESGLYRKH